MATAYLTYEPYTTRIPLNQFNYSCQKSETGLHTIEGTYNASSQRGVHLFCTECKERLGGR